MAEEDGIGLEGLVPTRGAIYIFGLAGVLLLTGAIILGMEGRLEPGLGFFKRSYVRRKQRPLIPSPENGQMQNR